MKTQTNLWIGLVEVSTKSINGVLGFSKGAYVNVLASASDINSFIEKVKNAINDLDLNYVQIEDIEEFSERIKNYEVSESLKKLAIEAKETKELRFGDFHTYN